MEPDPLTSFTMAVDAAPVPVLHLRGWLDHWATPHFRTETAHVLLARPCSVVLECGALTGIDAAGLRALMDLRRRLPTDGELVVVGASPLLRRLLAMTGLDRHVHIAEHAAGEVLDLDAVTDDPVPRVDLGLGGPSSHHGALSTSDGVRPPLGSSAATG